LPDTNVEGAKVNYKTTKIDILVLVLVDLIERKWNFKNNEQHFELGHTVESTIASGHTKGAAGPMTNISSQFEVYVITLKQ
jgi:hypothetical protein